MRNLFKALLSPYSVLLHIFIILFVISLFTELSIFFALGIWLVLVYIFWTYFLIKLKKSNNKKIYFFILSIILTPFIVIFIINKDTRKMLNPLESPVALTILITLIFILSHIFLILNSDNIFTNFIQKMERTLITSKYGLRGKKEVSNKVSIVDIDDVSLERYSWPINRKRYADLIDKLNKLGAKVIAFDIVFPDAGNSDSINIAKDFYDKFDKFSLSSQNKITQSIEKIIKNEKKLLIKMKKRYALLYDNIEKIKNLKNKNNEKDIELRLKKIKKSYYYLKQSMDNSNQLIFEYKKVLKSLKQKSNIYKTHLKNKASEIFPDRAFSEAIYRNKNIILGYYGYGNVENINKRISQKLQSENMKAVSSYQLNQGMKVKGVEPIDFSKLPFRELFGLQAPYKDIIWYKFPLDKKTINKAKEKISKLEEIPQELLDILEQEDGVLATKYFGAFNLIPDIDGVARNYFPAFLIKNKVIYSLGLQALNLYYKDKNSEADNFLIRKEVLENGVETGNLFFDLSGKNNLMFSFDQSYFILNYYGPMYSFEYISFKDIIENNLSEEYINKHIKNKIILIGTSASGLLDLRSIPFESGQKYPGVEIHATFIENALDNSFFKRTSSYQVLEMFALLIIGFLIGIIVYNVKIYIGLLFSLLLSISIFYLDVKLFFSNSYQLYTLHHILLPYFIFIGITALRYFSEEKEKNMIKKTFKFYLSKSVVDEVLKDPKNLKLGGEKKHLSVLFSDIRGFTTLSEGLKPVELSKLMNEYLTPMTKCVFQNGGTLDKYIGDAVMAFFGAPIKLENHAKNACQTALEMMEDLKELNKVLKSNNLPFIDIGIGINSGDMSVGNMGSNQRFDYTVLGDNVNLGARLEGINKQYKTNIIISEYTYEMVKDYYTCRLLDLVKVKGKNKPVSIYELVSDESKKDIINLSKEGIRLYHERKWDAAILIFNNILENRDDYLSKIYIERCLKYKKFPPDMDWDGSYVMTTK